MLIFNFKYAIITFQQSKQKGVIVLNKKILTVFIILLIFIFAVGCSKKPEKVSSQEVLNYGVIKVDVTDDEDENKSDNNSMNEDNSSNESSEDSENSSQDDTSSSDNSSVTENNSSNNSESSNSDNKENNDNNSSSDSTNSNTSKPGDSTQTNDPDKNSRPSDSSNSDKTDDSSKPSDSSKPNDTSKPDSLDSDDKQNDNSKPDKTDKEDKPSDTNKPDDEANKNENDSKEYNSIKCRPSSEISWKKVDLIVNKIKFNVRLLLPDDWSISSDGSIIRNGKTIGNIVVKSPASIVKSYEETNRTQVDNNSIIVKKSIYKSKDNAFKRLFTVSRLGNVGVMKSLYIDVNYSELSLESAEKFYEQLIFKEIKTTIPIVDSKKSNKILILGGNSISEDYAKITSFLNSMCNTAGENNFKFEIITKSKSNALSAFANDDQLLNKIKSGEYTYIFQNGFDTSNTSFGNMDDNGFFTKIYNACRDGNTKLILLPSFEDDINVIQTILEKFDNTFILNLKGELNNLIDSSIGTDKVLTNSDLINADNRFTKHAGFITAHLIYRNIFGKIPPAINSVELAYTDIQSKFAESYLTSGILPNENDIVSYVLN